MSKGVIWITRSQPAASTSAKRWQEAGYEAIAQPLITITLPQEMPAPPRKGSTLIITSKTSLRYLAEFTDRRDWDVITVGAASASLARSMGFKTVQSADGDARDLVSHVLENYTPSNGNFAYLSAANVQTDISDALSKHGYNISRHILYSNEPMRGMPKIEVSAVSYIAFYSTMAAEAFMQFGIDTSKITAISISAAVDQILSGGNFLTRKIAARPEEIAMIEALSS